MKNVMFVVALIFTITPSLLVQAQSIECRHSGFLTAEFSDAIFTERTDLGTDVWRSADDVFEWHKNPQGLFDLCVVADPVCAGNIGRKGSLGGSLPVGSNLGQSFSIWTWGQSPSATMTCFSVTNSPTPAPTVTPGPCTGCEAFGCCGTPHRGTCVPDGLGGGSCECRHPFTADGCDEVDTACL